MAGVRIGPQLGVWEVLDKQVAVVRVHHPVVVAIGDERRLRYAGETVELRLVRNTPGGDCGELRVASGQVGRFVAVDLALVDASERLHALCATLLGAGEEQLEQVLGGRLVRCGQGIHVVAPAV